MPVLWSLISSLHAPRYIAAARGALHMLSVRPREQQVAEKHYGEHLYTSSLSSHWSQLGVIYCFKNHFQEQNRFAPEND